MRLWARSAVLSLCCVAPAALGESVFNFDNIAAGTAAPISQRVNGVTAILVGNATICSTVGLSGNIFATLSGNAIMQNFCRTDTGGPLGLVFTTPLSKISFALAINGSTSVPVTVTYLMNGNIVGTQVIQPAVPNGSVSPEASVSYTGNFNSVVLSSTGLLAIDNLDVIPQ